MAVSCLVITLRLTNKIITIHCILKTDTFPSVTYDTQRRLLNCIIFSPTKLFYLLIDKILFLFFSDKKVLSQNKCQNPLFVTRFLSTWECDIYTIFIIRRRNKYRTSNIKSQTVNINLVLL